MPKTDSSTRGCGNWPTLPSIRILISWRTTPTRPSWYTGLPGRPCTWPHCTSRCRVWPVSVSVTWLRKPITKKFSPYVWWSLRVSIWCERLIEKKKKKLLTHVENHANDKSLKKNNSRCTFSNRNNINSRQYVTTKTSVLKKTLKLFSQHCCTPPFSVTWPPSYSRWHRRLPNTTTC